MKAITVYKCDCVARGDNISPHCPMHGMTAGEYYPKPEAEAEFARLEQQADEIYCDMNEILGEYRQKIAWLEAENKKLRLFKEMVEEQHNRVMTEQCASDEIHCACVPVLRAEIERLEIEMLRAEMNCISNTVVARSILRKALSGGR